jgi:hypothetical protein
MASPGAGQAMKLIPNTYNWEGWAQRALALIRGCHLALAQAKEEQPFFQEICRLLVEIGGYSLAWVGLAEKNKAKKIKRWLTPAWLWVFWNCSLDLGGRGARLRPHRRRHPHPPSGLVS